MFDSVKRNLVIERAYVLLRAEGLDVKNLISKMPADQQTFHRSKLHEMQTAAGLEAHDIAVMMASPYVDTFDFTTQFDLLQTVKGWQGAGLLKAGVLDFFKSKLGYPNLV